MLTEPRQDRLSQMLPRFGTQPVYRDTVRPLKQAKPMFDRMLKRSWRIVIAILVFKICRMHAQDCFAQDLAIEPVNEVFNRLTNTGDLLTAGTIGEKSVAEVALPRPTVTVGMNSTVLQSAIEEIFGKGDEGARYFRDSIVAPQILRMEKQRIDDSMSLRRVNFWFIAYGDLQKLKEDSIEGKLLAEASQDQDAGDDSTDQTAENRKLTPEELARCQISLIERPNDKSFQQHFARSSIHLFNKIDLDLTIQAVTTRFPHVLITAVIVDPRFDPIPEFANQWQRFQRDEAGDRKPLSNGPYGGAGGYVQLLQLPQPPNAILVEGHFAFREPQGWFDGANLLGSKMPTMIQMSARRMRKTLLTTIP